jgi:hypothetical protein
MARAVNTAAKSKQRKQLIILGVAGLILIIMLVIEVPSVMNAHNSTAGGPAAPAPIDRSASSTSTTPATTTPAITTPPTVTTPAPNAALVGQADSGAPFAELADTDPAPPAGAGQLLAFSRFAAKDPFKQQVQDPQAAGSTSTPSSTPPSSSAGSAASSGSGPSVVAGSPTPITGGSSSSGGTTKEAALTQAVISVNGNPENVPIGSTFPTANPFFRLVSLTQHSAQISIAGGSLSSGDNTVALTDQRPLTLMDTATGISYVLRLISVSSAPVASTGGASTTPTATTTTPALG